MCAICSSAVRPAAAVHARPAAAPTFAAARLWRVAHPRRRLLKDVAALALGAALPLPKQARGAAPRALSLVHTHTGERLHVTYFDGGAYVADALASINALLRDFRNGETTRIDPALFDTLHALNLACGPGTFEVISAFRSPATNEMLRARGTGVAGNSLHVHGRAIDVRLSGRDTGRLRDAAIALGRGGVGYYARSNFVHLDTGRVRTW
jgi:uncharacterized protein YcbK (DUF882 family)